MNTPELKTSELTPQLIIRHFSPAWFAAVMGTAVLPVALSFTGADWVPWAARIFMPLAAVMFVALLIPWSLKLLLFRADVARDYNHPIASSFIPTMPIALLVICLDVLKFGHLFWTAETARTIALWLWITGSAGIYVLGFVVVTHVFRHPGIEMDHANFGWYIPPVSKLLIPVAGFELAGHFPAHQDLLVGVSLASLGIGFYLFIFVGAAGYHRYLFRGLPAGKFAATFFIGAAPPAIIAVALFKLMRLVAEHEVFGLTAAVIGPVARLAIMANWGLAAWWFLMALILLVYYKRRLGLPFALSWWAFTFPSGAVAIASGLAFQISGIPFVHGFYSAVVVFLLVVWLVVFALTVRGLANRRLLLPTH